MQVCLIDCSDGILKTSISFHPPLPLKKKTHANCLTLQCAEATTFDEGEKVLCYHHGLLYEAKVLKLDTDKGAGPSQVGRAKNSGFYFVGTSAFERGSTHPLHLLINDGQTLMVFRRV